MPKWKFVFLTNADLVAIEGVLQSARWAIGEGAWSAATMDQSSREVEHVAKLLARIYPAEKSLHT